MSPLPDPCPIPDKDQKTLKKKDALLFAPLSNIGAVSSDKDAIYIDIGHANYTNKEDIQGNKDDDDEQMSDAEYNPEEPAGMLKGLQDVDDAVDEKMDRSTLRLFKGSKAIEAGSDDDDNDDEVVKEIHTNDMVPFRSRRVKDIDVKDAEDSDSDESGSDEDNSDSESES